MKYRTFKRSCNDWKSFGRAKKYEDMSGLTYEEAYLRCQALNAELSKSQIKRGTKFEFERE